jgi:Glycosyl transferase family 2
MPKSGGKLPAVTILIEWENAMDVEAYWVHRALQAFAAELAHCKDNMSTPARVMYLYDRSRVQEQDIRDTIAKVAPRLHELCVLELVPTPGLTYYQLKNYGAQRAKTEFVVMLDSDAAPQPGWLPGLLKPFEDAEVMAVGGFTILGHNNLVSRVMALIWTFNLRSEHEITLRRKKIHANNCAFRTEFFQANPWPDLPAFKKQCGFWLRDIDRRGIKWVRTTAAMTVHAPQPGISFLIWRAWIAGCDRDVQTYYTVSPSRCLRLGFAVYHWLKKCWRSTRRIVTKGHEVQLPMWQMPAALFLAYGYDTILFAAQVVAALTRGYAPPAALQQATQS